MSISTLSFIILNFTDQYTLRPYTNNGTNSTTPSSDCILLHFGDFIPWDNPENIITLQTEDLVRKLKDLVFLPVLFLIGCPANIINMVIFYKQALKERINVCLFALSLSDELYLVCNILFYGEQLYLRATTGEMYGPVFRFVTDYNLLGFYAFLWISQILTAIIAADRCFCVLQPLRSQNFMQASTMAVIVVVVNIAVTVLLFFVVTRYRVSCGYNPLTDSFIAVIIPSQFYVRHQEFVDYLEAFVFGAGLPGAVMVVVVTTTTITTVKLRQAAVWRAETSSSSGLSQKEIALTKMLVANSAFFMACVFPFIVGKLVVPFMPEATSGRRQHNFHLMIQWVLTIINYFNSTFNFVIYYNMGSRYRQTFWQLFARSSKKN